MTVCGHHRGDDGISRRPRRSEEGHCPSPQGGHSNAHPRSSERRASAPFNWSDDGCSGPFLIRPVYRSLFNRPCQQHDFGYRNYGGGLRLGRNENARAWIDGRFLSEMRRLCTSKWGVLNPHRHTCLAQAGAVWTGVRHGGRTAFYH
jgi:Prokaryotic phospholipase A2